MPPASKDVSARLRADDRKLDPDLRRARRKFKKFGREVSRDLKASFSKVRGALRTVAGLGGIVGFAQLGREVLEFETRLERLRIAAGGSRSDFGKFRDEITAVSNETGQSRNDIVGAAQSFVALTGDADTARKSMAIFAKVATATGTDINEVAVAATDLSDKFKLKPGEFEGAFDVLIAQGNKGAIELNNLASELTSIAPLFAQFGKSTGKAGLAEMGALFQVVRKGAGSAKEAGTNMQNLLGGIGRQARKHKVSLFTMDPETGKKRKRTITEMLEAFDALAKSGKKGKSVDQLFPDKQMKLAFLAWQANKGLMKDLTDTTKTAGTTARQFAEFQASSAGKIATGWQRVKNQLTGIFTPERIDMFAKAIDKLVRLVEILLDNFTEVALVVGGAKFLSMGLTLRKAAAGADGLKASLAGALGNVNLIIAATSGLLALQQLIIGGLEKKQEKAIDERTDIQSVRRNVKALEGPQSIGAARNLVDTLTKNGKLTPQAKALSRTEAAPRLIMGDPASQAALDAKAATVSAEKKSEIDEAIKKSNEVLQSFIAASAARTLIQVTVDQQGLLRAEVGKAKKERRSR